MKTRTEQYRIGHGGYVSEFEQFLQTYLHQHPEVEQDQMRGWYIWWDHRVDLAELEKEKKAEVPAKPYQYE